MPAVPSTVGPYRLLAELGRGGSGTVYRAQGPDGEVVALKLQRPTTPEDALYLEREYRLQAELGGDGILPLLQQGQTPAGHYAAFPLLEGGDLAQRILRAPLPWPEAVELVRVLAHALAKLHAAGVVHRDLKPANVLLDAEGRPWLADLGLSKHADRARSPHTVSLTATGVLAGTPGYLAPEQAADFKRAAPPADVFALGALLYAAIVGRDPFEAATLSEFLERSARGEARPLREAAPDAPRWLEALIARALDPDPAARPADALAFAERLAPSPPPPPAGSSRRLGYAAALALAGLGLLTLTWSLRPDPTPTATSTPPPADDLEQARALFSRGDYEGCYAGCTQALTREPSAPARCLRSEAALELNRYEEALDDAREALRLAPKDPLALVTRGRARLALGRADASLEDARAALEQDPGFARAYTLRGTLAGRGGDLEGALADSERALALTPDEPEALQLRGTALRGLGRLGEALVVFDRCLELEPWRATVRVQRADLYLGQGQAALALVEATRAAAEFPHAAFTHLVRGKAFMALGRWPEAVAPLERATELDPGNPILHEKLGHALLRAGDLARAEDSLRRSLELGSGRLVAWADLADVHTQLQRHADAVADLSRALELAPERADLLLWRAQQRSKLEGGYTAALADLDRALAQDLPPEKEAGAQALRAACLQSLERYEEALPALARVLELQPGDDSARLLRARLLLELERPREALAELDRMREPNTPRLLYARGSAHLQLGDYALAERELKASIRHVHDRARPHRALAEVYLATDRPQEALSSARVALELERDAHSTQAVLARAHAASGDARAAEQAWRAAIELAPPPTAARYRAELEALGSPGQGPAPR